MGLAERARPAQAQNLRGHSKEFCLYPKSNGKLSEVLRIQVMCTNLHFGKLHFGGSESKPRMHPDSRGKGKEFQTANNGCLVRPKFP